MKSCSKCLLPETHETIEFDSKNKCNICAQHEFKKGKINWSLKRKEFEKIVSKYKEKGSYDCIVPYSGGKDSVYTLWRLVEKFKLKCLVVSFNHGFFRPNLIDNRTRIFSIR